MDIVERLATHIYGHSREKAIEWAKEDKFDSCYLQAEDIVELLGVERLQKIEAAARNLVVQKGRHHTQQAYEKLAALLGQKLSPNDSVTY